MTGSISRKLYQQFLLLYPEPFRHEFGDEMLALWEECKAAQGGWRLLADVVVSAVKQQIHYHSTPVPDGAPLYSEIACFPKLARMLTVAVFAAALVVSVLLRGNQKASQSPVVVRQEALFWFPILGWERYCLNAPARTGGTREGPYRRISGEKFRRAGIREGGSYRMRAILVRRA